MPNILGMLWTNKVWKTLRLSQDRKGYLPWLSDIAFRYEPMVYQKYDLRAKQIAFKLFSDVVDLKVADRVYDADSNIWFVVAWVAHFWDTLWKHLEVVMRQIWPSSVHEAVTRKKLDTVQSSYDPLLEERTEYGKIYKEDEILVLVDSIELAKSSIIQMIDQWRIEQVQYMMTTEVTEDIKKEDRFMYWWFEYIVEWILPQPYQQLVWLNKSMVNYSTP